MVYKKHWIIVKSMFYFVIYTPNSCLQDVKNNLNGTVFMIIATYSTEILISVMSIQINEILTLNINISRTTIQSTVLLSMS